MKALLACLGLVMCLNLVGCAMTKVNREAIVGIKKVAILGYSQEEEDVPTLTMALAGKRETGMMATGSALAKESPHATQAYAALAEKLEKTFKWKVLDRNQVVANNDYKKYFERKTTGLQNRPPVSNNYTVYGASGVLDVFPIRILDVQERAAYLKSLGADAIVIARPRVSLERLGVGAMIGAGKFRPKCELSFALYDGKSEDPLWEENAAPGELEVEGVPMKLGFADREALQKLTMQAISKSYDSLIARYKEAQ